MSTSVTTFQAPALDKVRILVVGDVMLGRLVGQRMDADGRSPWDEWGENPVAAVVGNFEEAINAWRRDASLWKHANEGVILASASGAFTSNDSTAPPHPDCWRIANSCCGWLGRPG